MFALLTTGLAILEADPSPRLQWIHHLATKLLSAKKLKRPIQLASRPPKGLPVTGSPARRAPVGGTPRRAARATAPSKAVVAQSAIEWQAWTALKDAEKRLGEQLAQASANVAGKGKAAKPRKGKKVEAAGWTCAGDLVDWWAAQGRDE